MIRNMDFRMSREGLMEVGDTVTLAESTLSTLAGTLTHQRSSTPGVPYLENFQIYIQPVVRSS